MLKRRWVLLGVMCLGFVWVGGAVGCGSEPETIVVIDMPEREQDAGGGTTDVDGEDAVEDVAPELSELAIRAMRITPSEVFNDSEVRCEADAVAPGVAVPSVVYLWERTTTGAELGEGSVLSLAGKGLQPGGGVTCRAVATLDGARVTRDASVAILNRAPVVESVTVSASTVLVGQSVTCTAVASDADGGSPTLSYAWFFGAVQVGTGPVYTVSSGEQAGDTVTCVATATDPQQASHSLSASVSVDNPGPTAPPGFVLIPAGTYTQGPFGGVSRTVTISRSFYLQATEVTQKQWRDLMGSDPSRFSSCGDNCPVEQVSWWDALAYMNALSTQEGLQQCYNLSGCTGSPSTGNYICSSWTSSRFVGLSCTGYRLPTEAEWGVRGACGNDDRDI